METKSMEHEKIRYDCANPDLPESVKNFLPDVYINGDEFYCIMGVEDNVIIGTGNTPEMALKNWDASYQMSAGKIK